MSVQKIFTDLHVALVIFIVIWKEKWINGTLQPISGDFFSIWVTPERLLSIELFLKEKRKC